VPRVATYRVEGRAGVVRALLAVAGVLAALVLLGPSPLAAAADRPRPAAAPAGSSACAPAGTATSMEAPRSAVLVRATGIAVLPAPTGPAAGLLPGHGTSVAPHLLAQPTSRPPTARLPGSAAQAPSSRAPPGPAGT
jgi:hypothetical protein